MTTVLTINDRVLSGLDLLRRNSEDVQNWVYVREQDRIRLSAVAHKEWDVHMAFNWVVYDGVVMRYLSVWDKRGPIPVDVSLACTLAHHLGYSGGTMTQTGVVQPGSTWRIHQKKDSGQVVIQQDVQKLGEA